MNKYDAVVIDEGNDKFKIQSIKSNDFNQKIMEAVTGSGEMSSDNDKKRGVGSNIVGYLTMFILLQGLMLMMLYSDDRENRTLKRIGTSPVSIGSYLFSHSVFAYILIFVPTFTVLVVCKELLSINIGFGYLQYFLLLGVLTLLSTAFALFMGSVMDKTDNCMMMGQSIVILTSILSGSFYSFGDGNVVMRSIIGILPQKGYLNIVQGIEQGKRVTDFLPQLAYLVTLPALLFVLGAVVCKRKFNRGCC